MSKITSLLTVFLAAAFLSAGMCRAAQITDIQVFSEDDYARVAITLDQPVEANVEINAGEKLVFVRFDKAGIENLTKQSLLYEDNPHLESVTFLPLGTETTVVRVKARHPFKVKTYEIKNPSRFILELSERTPSQQTGRLGGSMLEKGYYVQAVRQMQRGNYNSALMAFRSAIRAGNRVADSYYQAGLIRYKLGQSDKALINFNRAQKSSSFGDDARLYLCWIHYKNEDYTLLAGSWKNFVSNLPDEKEQMSLITGHPEIDYRALEEAAKNELNGPARKVSTPSAIQNNVASEIRETASVYFAKGLVAKEEGRLEEAAQFLEKAISLDSSYTETHFQLGVVYKAMGRNKLSVQHFEKSLGSGGGLRKKSGEPVKSEEEPLPGEHERQVLDSEPVTEDAARDNPGDDRKDSASAGLISQGGSEGASEAGPGKIQPGQARDENPMLASLRQTVANVIALPNVGLLRRQVKILTVILGVLFLLTLVGEKVALRKFGKRKAVVPNSIMEDRAKSNPESQDTGTGRPMTTNVEKKRQMEAVLAKELAAKRRASQPAIGATESGLELHLQPVGERGMYGADIAKRIKEELSRADQPESLESGSTPFGRKQDNLQARLIRQLRSKNWTISDIAQEMNLSREEIKWALAGSSEAKETQAGKTSGKNLDSHYGQARSLLDRKKEDYQGIKPESIDREVDLELEINV